MVRMSFSVIHGMHCNHGMLVRQTMVQVSVLGRRARAALWQTQDHRALAPVRLRPIRRSTTRVRTTARQDPDAKAVDELGLTAMLRADNSIGDKGVIGAGPTTPFRKPPGGELLDWQKEFNTAINKISYVIERAIANFKTRLGGACSPTTADHYAPTQPPSAPSGRSISSNFRFA